MFLLDNDTSKVLLTVLLVPLLGTMLGSAFVFVMKKDISSMVQKALLGFASGVMIAASVWSLLIPSMEMRADCGKMSVLLAVVGLLCGFGFLLLLDFVIPHLHPDGVSEGPESHLSKTVKLVLAVTIHNFPEGMAVGAVIAGVMAGTQTIGLAGAVALASGIALQNIPEGAIISMPMRAAGNSRWRSFLLGSLSGVAEPLGAVLVVILASAAIPAMPYLLAFAAGAMLYVVFDELIPEASSGDHSNVGIIGFALGFALMMVLDVVLG